jgi:hypothetical protein
MVAVACGHAAPSSTEPHSHLGVLTAGDKPQPLTAQTTVALPARPDAALPRDATIPVALEDYPRLAALNVELFRAWNQALSGASGCADATKRLAAIADASREVIDANVRLRRGDPDKLRAFTHELAAHRDELAAAGQLPKPLLSACATDAEFRRAVDRLQGTS